MRTKIKQIGLRIQIETLLFFNVLKKIECKKVKISNKYAKKRVLYGIPWVIEFELTNYKVNHVDKIVDIPVSSGPFLSELNL